VTVRALPRADRQAPPVGLLKPTPPPVVGVRVLPDLTLRESAPALERRVRAFAVVLPALTDLCSRPTDTLGCVLGALGVAAAGPPDFAVAHPAGRATESATAPDKGFLHGICPLPSRFRLEPTRT
jgi:hypothetical protein